jgi:murein DD-endopeptidase MepM/ murein hydrolase activator NlpD
VSALSRSLVVAVLAAALCLPVSGLAFAANPDKPLVWPTRGRQTQRYGCTGFWAEPRYRDCAHFHHGIDIANARGTPIRAAADGVVEHVGWDPFFPRRLASWLVIIDHGRGMRTLYGHLTARAIDGIEKGARVTQGQMIGRMDATGLATGVHLHYAVYVNGSSVNPREITLGPLPRRQPKDVQDRALCAEPGYGGVGAWLGGRTAMVKPEVGEPTCVG